MTSQEKATPRVRARGEAADTIAVVDSPQFQSTTAANPAATAPQDQAAAFLHAVYGDGAPGWLTIYTLPNRVTAWVQATDLDHAATLALNASKGGQNVYVGVGLQRERLHSGRGTAATVGALVALWADVDIAGPGHTDGNYPPDEAAALAVVAEFPLPPTVIVHSGHGLQPWWLFREAWTLDTDTERAQAAELARRWLATLQRVAARHGWRLDATADLARVLRLPGTTNWKLPEAPAPVRLLQLHNDTRYTRDDFEPYLADDPELEAGNNGHSPASPLPQTIPNGERNVLLTSLAGSMRRRGATREAIEAALLAQNRTCETPLPVDEVQAIAGSVARYEPAPADGDLLVKDYGHAAVLATLFQGRYRWATHRGSWMQYTGTVWRPVPEEQVAKDASDALRQHYSAALAVATDKATIQDLSKKAVETCIYARITGALAFLRGWPGFLTLPDQWDADPWLLNIGNGTLDLRTGTLRPHSPDDLLTKLAPVSYDPQAAGGYWQAHLDRFLPNPNVRRQVQRDLGLALVGATLEEALSVWYGIGRNGKTTTAKTLLKVLGDYSDRAAPNLLIQSKHERHPTELADLAGLRLVFSIEVDQGKHLAEALVKDLTGGDRKKGRFMRQDFFSFEQTFSITLIVNHKPIITGTDVGIWRRIRLIPWEYRITDAERRPQDEVVAELTSEGPAILNWLLAGLRDWQSSYYWVAPEVQVATDAYRAEMDVLGDFI